MMTLVRNDQDPRVHRQIDGIGMCMLQISDVSGEVW